MRQYVKCVILFGMMVLAVAGCMSVTSAQEHLGTAQAFKQLDANEDERITSNELSIPQAFDVLDRDGDGAITAVEAREAVAEMTPENRRRLASAIQNAIQGETAGADSISRAELPERLASDTTRKPSNGFVVGKHKTMEYQFFEPPNLRPGDRVPLIIGLHGSGKRQADISNVLMNFHRIPANPEFQEQYPCYVLAPKTTKSWFPVHIADPELTSEQVSDLPAYWKEQYKETMTRINNPPEGGFGELEVLLELIDKVVAENDIDLKRIYIVGFSMGGTGAWQAIAARPKFFAAAMPAAGGRLWPWQWSKDLLAVPIWAFQGSRDRGTVAARHQASFDYAKKNSGNMKYTEFEGAGHGVSGYAFTSSGEIEYDGEYRTSLSSNACDAEENVWKWLFKQERTE